MADKSYLRIGKISSIDYANGKASVTYEDLNDSTTAAFSFLAWQYMMPEEGEQVLVAHLSNGTSSAVILGPVWHDGNRPPEGQEGLYRKDYSRQDGEAYQRYDEGASEYSERITGTYDIQTTEDFTLSVNGTSVITVKADGSITLSAPSGIAIAAPLVTVTGDVVAGSISLQNHTHTGVHGETSPAH